MMNGRHLPAGQGMHHEMNRRRQYNQQQYQPPAGMYNGYYNQNFYPQVPPQYQHVGVPQNPYAAPYPPMYGRSPTLPYQQYSMPPPVLASPVYPQPPQPRPHQSPAIVSSPYQPPPPPQIPSSTHSPFTAPAPSTPAHSTPQTTQLSPVQSEAQPVPRSAFQPPLPWLSRPDLPWPKSNNSRRKRKRAQDLDQVELPTAPNHDQPEPEQLQQPEQEQEKESSETLASAAASVPRPETPSTNQPASEEAASTTPTTPSSVQQSSQMPTSMAQTTKSLPRSIAVPIIPVIPKVSARTSPTVLENSQKSPEEKVVKPATDNSGPAPVVESEDASKPETEDDNPNPAPVAAAPKSWANLFKGPPPAVAPIIDSAQTNAQNSVSAGSFSKKNIESLSDALVSFNASTKDAKIAFLEPRGLVNTGNMCYMNSVLQVLVFCIPFYDFLDQVGKRAAHSFKSDTPLIDVMIMFMREFPIIDSAHGVEQLRMRLKENELEKYGDAFTPDFVYDVIRILPRFSSMRRGHQQDAEEFLGFFLEGLHDECVQVMQSAMASQEASGAATPSGVASSSAGDGSSRPGSSSGEAANGWLEVGPKQRAAITRSSGTILFESPVTKIFGGTLRSELRVPGLKTSVTIEPYKPLQLDIGSPQVNNIIDALKNLTHSENLHGDFKSPRGPGVTATKQVLIETLPPVLILHLKRFQYDNTGGTQKIWKKVGYPLELEIPKEVFTRQKQAAMLNHGGLPKYRLIAVVYHHGKNASGGHYTVDVRRQDGREWIRLDDTLIRRVRSEDVAEGGSEDDPKVLAAALEAHKQDSITSGNMFAQMKLDDDETAGSEDEWKQVNGDTSKANGQKKWSNVVNGSTVPKARTDRYSVKDNKVAYLLFYQKIEN